MTGPIALGATLLLVFGRAVQQLNVTGGHYLAAALTPFLIAAGEIAVVGVIVVDGWDAWPWIGTGGGIGAVGAMWMHAKVRSLKWGVRKKKLGPYVSGAHDPLVMHSEVRELIDAAKNMRDAANRLWHAQNPEDGPENEVALSIEEAQQQHSDAFLRLLRAEYYAEKAIAQPLPAAGYRRRCGAPGDE